MAVNSALATEILTREKRWSAERSDAEWSHIIGAANSELVKQSERAALAAGKYGVNDRGLAPCRSVPSTQYRVLNRKHGSLNTGLKFQQKKSFA